MKKIAAILAILFAVLNIACAKDTETKKVNEIYLTANGTTWTVTLEQNKSSAALVELLRKGDLTIHTHDKAESALCFGKRRRGFGAVGGKMTKGLW